MTRRRVFENLLLVLVSLMFASGMSEIVLRVLGYQPLDTNRERLTFSRYDSLLGWHHRPGQEGIFEKSGFRVSVRINQKGLRGHEYPYEREEGKKRVLVLGDSFVWGYGVEQNQIFTEQMENSLSDVEVINAGVSGYSTDQELLWLKSEGIKYHPDLVILVVSSDDDYMNIRERVFQIYYKPRFTLGQDSHLELHNIPVPQSSSLRRSIFFLCTYSSLANYLISYVRPKIVAVLDRTLKASTLLETSEKFALTFALIDSIANVVTTINARFMIVSVNKHWFVESDPTDREPLRILEDKGYDVLDIDERKGYSEHQMTIPDDGHWNKDGHTFVAQQLKTFIEQRALLEEGGLPKE